MARWRAHDVTDDDVVRRFIFILFRYILSVARHVIGSSSVTQRTTRREGIERIERIVPCLVVVSSPRGARCGQAVESSSVRVAAPTLNNKTLFWNM